MDQDVTVRPAREADVAALPAMQVAAGGLFCDLDMDRVANGPAPDLALFDEARIAGRLLVALVEENVVGFVRLEVLDGALHVDQVTVSPEVGRRGIGRHLMLAVEHVARQNGYDRLTLTTFRDVPFNGPFYASLGWQVLPQDDLPHGLAAARQEEAEAGLDEWPRQAMVRRL